MVWHFSNISLQYIIGGSLSLIITGYMLYKNPKTLEVVFFFLYGLFTSIWAISIFFHRVIPTADASRLFFKVAMFSLPLCLAFLLTTILCIRKPKKSYLLYVTPAVILGIFIVVSPIEVYLGRWGWSYRFLLGFMNIFIIFNIVYSVLICVATFLFIKKCKFLAVQKKYKIILVGCLLYVTIPPVTNYMISHNPNFPPSTGIVTTIFFLFIAYAINLPTEKIIPSKSMNEIANSYLQFLNAFQAKTPGKELGGSSFRFQEYLEGMGLKDIVVPKSGKLVFEVGKLSKENISETPDNILRIMKERSWARETMDAFVNVFVRTYQTLSLKSKEVADKWLGQMLKRHGAFLAEHGVLAAMPKQVKIPEILKKLRSGRTHLFEEEKPAEAYQLVKKALGYGFASLCISKLHPGKVKERYGVEEDSILWLTFEKGERTISPKDIGKLNKTVSGFVEGTRSGIVLLDCLDQIKFANGFQKSLAILKDLRDLCSKNDSIVLISVNPEMFEQQELQAIEKELKGVRI